MSLLKKNLKKSFICSTELHHFVVFLYRKIFNYSFDFRYKCNMCNNNNLV